MLAAAICTEANQDTILNRTLLPYSINSYQPTLLPVITIDSKELYLDRKWHPMNLGEGIDSDDIWMSQKLNGGFWSDPKNLEYLNTKNTDILFAITPDNNTAILYGSYINNNEGFYIAEKINGKWSIRERLKIINYYNNWDKFGASVSHDKKTLILALNRKDSRGGLDLYVSKFIEDRKIWSAPVNIGKSINTAGIEAAPFLSYDNKTLYFASNGHKGFGKLDLFMSKRIDDSWTEWSKPKNLGPLFNTHEDENSIWITALADTAYIVSYDTLNARSSIFSVIMPDSLKPFPYYLLTGSVYFIKNDPQKYSVNIHDDNGKLINSFNSSDNKYFSILQTDQKYKITAKSANFEDYIFNLKTENTEEISSLNRDIVFKPIEKPRKQIHTIYFKFNESRLSNDNKQKLYAIVSEDGLPKNHRIEITGHADETGTEAYNTELSYKRAKNVSYFLKDLGIDEKNIKVEWKGEDQPASTDPEKNRRVEIIIIPL